MDRLSDHKICVPGLGAQLSVNAKSFDLESSYGSPPRLECRLREVIILYTIFVIKHSTYL